jgi:subtilase family serine protease
MALSQNRARSRKRIAALIGIPLALLLAMGAAWVGYGYLQPKQPQVIYVVYDPGPMPTATPSVATSPSAEPSVEASVSSEPSATPEPSPSATTAPTAPPPIPLVTPAPKPNLMFAAHTTPAPRCGITFTWNVAILNNGPVASSATTVRFTDMFSGHAIATHTAAVPVLPAGLVHAATWTVAIASACGAGHTLLAEIDPGDSIDESLEGDNALQISYVLQHMPDMETSAFTMTPAHPHCGDMITLTETVHNRGGAAMPRSTTVRFVDSWNNVVQHSVTRSIPALAAGGTVTVSASLTVDTHCSSTHSAAAIIDPVDQVEESNETNNIYTHPFAVGP